MIARKSEIGSGENSAFEQSADAMEAENRAFLFSLDSNDSADPSSSLNADRKSMSSNGKDVSKVTETLTTKAEFYGPNRCLSTYSKEGTCWIATHGCRDEAMRETNLGFTCVSETGDATQHYFGAGAFNVLVQSKAARMLPTS